MTTINPKVHMITDMGLFDRLCDYYNRLQPKFSFFDLETNTKNVKKAKLWGIGLCFVETTGFYIPWRNKSGELIWSESDQKVIINWVNSVLEKTKLIGHNLIYDVLVWENNTGYKISDYIYSDTILQHHTLSEDPPHGLKEIAVEYLGPEADKAQKALMESVLANGGKWNKNQKDMYLAETEILGEYCIWDVILTCKLFHIFESRLEEENLYKLFYEEETIPLYKEVTINMKRKGFPIDVSHFENLKETMSKDIYSIEKQIMEEIEESVQPFVQELLDDKFPVSTSANAIFPKKVAEYYGVTLPKIKKKNKETGEISYHFTLGGKALEKQKKVTPEYEWFYYWIISKGKNEPEQIQQCKFEVQKQLFFRKKENEGKPVNYIFNLSSGDHLAHLIYEVIGIKCEHWTDGGKSGIPKPSTKADVLDEIIETHSNKHNFLPKLLDYRRLKKLYSTYVIGILDKEIDGVIYPDMLQHGTTSSRYASRNPNCQNLPSIKDEDSGLSEVVMKYTNAIRKGFIAPKGYKIVNADYSQLEVMCFGNMSNSEKLIASLNRGEDLYSAIAIEVEKLTEYSANKKADNYLKKHKPTIRAKFKVPALGVVYGMGESRMMEALGCDFQEARTIINNYLNTYSDLKKYMWKCEYDAKTKGYVKNVFGRVRHLPKAKELHGKYGDNLLKYKWAKQKNLLKERRELKNLLNNAKNFPIQSLAAGIVNRASIKAARKLIKYDMEGWQALQVHDELSFIVKETQAEEFSKKLQQVMENIVSLKVNLKAEPLIADNWADAK